MQQQDQSEIIDAAEKAEQEPITPPDDSAEQEPPAGSDAGDGANPFLDLEPGLLVGKSALVVRYKQHCLGGGGHGTWHRFGLT